MNVAIEKNKIGKINKINKTRYALLGMLFDSQMSGYEIKQFMLGSTANFWKESDASIYPMLKILEKEGMVASKSELKGKRESRKFEITDAGKKEFLEWMGKTTEKESRRNELLLKLFFGKNVNPEESIKKLHLRLAKVKKEYEQFIDIQDNVLAKLPDDYPNKIFWSITLRNGILLTEAEIKWIVESIKALKKLL
jgi:DNA-binding PadR family transcriptional regulator